MFDFIKKKFLSKNSYEIKLIEKNEIYIPMFYDIVIYLPENRKVNFPEEFEKDKFFCRAQELYENSKAKATIDSIEIKGRMMNAGETDSSIVDNSIHTIIRIEAFKLGIVYHSGIVKKYSDDLLKQFIDIFSHELIHAEDNNDIVTKYGPDTFLSLKKNETAYFAHHILSEYSACRKTTEQYGVCDSPENINKAIKILNSLNGIKNDEMLKQNIYALYYTLATICAFADALKDEKWVTISNYADVKYQDYINRFRKLLNQYYAHMPIDLKGYNVIGDQLLEIKSI